MEGKISYPSCFGGGGGNVIPFPLQGHFKCPPLLQGGVNLLHLILGRANVQGQMSSLAMRSDTYAFINSFYVLNCSFIYILACREGEN